MSVTAFAPFLFAPPTAWARRVTWILVGEGSEEAPPNISITREVRAEHEDLGSYALRKVTKLTAMPDFELLSCGPTQAGGQPAFRTLVRWSVAAGVVTQAQAFVAGPDRALLSIVCSSIGEPSAFDELERLLASVRLGAEEPSAPAAAPPKPPPAILHHAEVPFPGTRTVRR